MGNGGNNFVVYASAKATCGRSDDDYYGCRSARAEARLSIKSGDAALLVEAVNSHAALKARITELEKHLKSVSSQCGNVIYNCEQRPADNERHLSSWRAVKEYADAALQPKADT
jgi:hypothetical protein